MAHIDAGKTTTTERILYYTGVTYKMGEVDQGTAVMDWMDQEQERGITITSAATQCEWNGYKINIIDTPGHVDFTAEVERSLRVLDGAVIVLCGVGGVEPQTEKVWYQSTKYNIPKLAYINKLDRLGADPEDVVNQIEEKFNITPLLLQLPLGLEDKFEGVIDLVNLKAYKYKSELLGAEYDEIDIPDEYIDEVELHRDNLIEQLAEIDMDVMELFIEKKEISADVIKKAVRNSTLNLKAVPVVMGSSFKNKGVQNLLDAIVDYLPSPIDKGDIEGVHPKTGEKIKRRLSYEEPFSSIVFKIVSDKHAGQLAYFRVYSGSVKAGSTVYNSTAGEKVKVQKLLRMHSNKREEIKEVFAGDIAATVGLKSVHTGDTLCDERHHVVFNTINFPEPVIFSTIEPKSSADHDKLDQVLTKLIVEDPTLKTYVDKNTGQKILSGMGELHLEVIKERIRREFNIETKLGKPRVAYKETIRQESIGEENYMKETGDAKSYAYIKLRVSPDSSNKKYVFVNSVRSDKLKKDYLKAIEKGINEAMDIGVIAGFPIMKVKVELLDVDFNEDETNDIAFKIATSSAFTKAFRNGNPILLEPIMRIEIIVQDNYLGDVINDFNARGGKVSNMKVKGNLHIIDGFVPLSSMFGYAKTLRTLTQGRGNYSMEFNKYVEMDDKKMKNVLEKELGIYSYN